MKIGCSSWSYYRSIEQGIEKRIDYEKIFRILKERNYIGFLSIKFEGEEDELSFMPKGVAYLKRMRDKFK